MPSLEAMRTFIEVVQSGSYVAAAARLGISPSVISRQISEAERRLGARLLNRTTRRMTVTNIGETYYESCRSILAQVEQIEEDVATLQGKEAGRITIRMSHSLGILQIGGIVLSFCSEHPSIKISVAFDEFPLRSFERMERCSDVVLHSGRVSSPSVVAREVAQVAWLPFASPHYLRKCQAPKTPDDLHSHNCLVHQTVSPNGRWHFRNSQVELSVAVAGTISANSALMLREAAENGLGIALLPSFCVEEAVSSGRLVRLLPNYEGQERPLYVVYEATRMLPRRTRLFIDYLAARLKTSLSSRPGRLAKQNRARSGLVAAG